MKAGSLSLSLGQAERFESTAGLCFWCADSESTRNPACTGRRWTHLQYTASKERGISHRVPEEKERSPQRVRLVISSNRPAGASARKKKRSATIPCILHRDASRSSGMTTIVPRSASIRYGSFKVA